MTSKLPLLPTLVGLALIFMGLHFDNIECRIIGGLYLGYGTIIHIRNINLVRQTYTKQRIIL